jgi:hypothetical protein
MHISNQSTTDSVSTVYVEIRAEDLAADWPAQRKALFESVGVDDFATTSTFRSRSLDHRNDQFDSDTRALIERALADVIPTMGYE